MQWNSWRTKFLTWIRSGMACTHLFARLRERFWHSVWSATSIRNGRFLQPYSEAPLRSLHTLQKASTRAAANVSTEPFSNWVLSLTEDGIAFLLVWLVGSHPVIGLVLALLLTVAAIVIIWKLSRLIRRVFHRAA